MTGLFARHEGRHSGRKRRPAGSWTGWSALAVVARLRSVLDDFSRPRTASSAPLAAFPMAADPFPSLADDRHPYDSPKDAA